MNSCWYCPRPARFDRFSDRPRCECHWRYRCSLCLVAFHFNALSHCAQEDDLYCQACSLGEERCPFCGERHPALAEVDPPRRLVEEPEGLVRWLEPGAGFFPPESEPRDDAVEQQWSRNAQSWVGSLGPSGDAARVVSDPVLLELLGPVEGLELLDAGAGEGYLSRLLWRQRPARLCSLELSRVLHERARALQSEGIEYVQASVCSMPFPDASFDRLVANNVLMYCPDAEAAVHELFRVLRPGGWAAVCFSHPCFTGPVSTPLVNPPDSPRTEDARFRVVGNYFARRPMAFVQPGYSSSITFFARPLSDYFRLFTAAGFEVTHLVEPQPRERDRLPPGLFERLDSLPLSLLWRLLRPSISA
ncbi:MAG: hypothetical protein AMXMBFR33_73180 [Candidatus Xenobia bacterium]